jgi:hypothetical protein
LQHLQLMAEREDLQVQSGARSHHASEHRQPRHQHGHHRGQSLPVAVGIFNGLNAYRDFSMLNVFLEG